MREHAEFPLKGLTGREEKHQSGGWTLSQHWKASHWPWVRGRRVCYLRGWPGNWVLHDNAQRVIISRGISEGLVTQMCDYNTNKYPRFLLEGWWEQKAPKDKPDRQHVIGCFLRLHCHNNDANVPECATDLSSANLRSPALPHINTCDSKVMKTGILKRSVLVHPLIFSGLFLMQLCTCPCSTMDHNC